MSVWLTAYRTSFGLFDVLRKAISHRLLYSASAIRYQAFAFPLLPHHFYHANRLQLIVEVASGGCDLVDDLDASKYFIEDVLAPLESLSDHILMLVRLAKKRYPVRHATLLMSREVAMPVQLNITIDDDVYARLKTAVPPKKLSAFIAEAIRIKLHPDAKALDIAYQAASKEQWRKSLDENWKHIDAEGWPK